MTLEKFNKKYIYKQDIDKYGFKEVWLEPKEVDGVYEGDCEDYCIYLKRNIAEFKDWDYYYCKLNGEGHCVLSDGVNIIDCNCKRVMTKDAYVGAYKPTDLKRLNWFIVGSKFYLGYIVITLNTIKKLFT